MSDPVTISISDKSTDAALGKALLAAVQRAREDDRCTRIMSGDEWVAAVVPTEVGAAFYDLPDAARKEALASKNGPAQ